MKTIPKNRKALVDRILNAGRNFRCYSPDNGFSGQPMDHRRGNIMAPADWMRKELRGRSAKLINTRDNHYTIRVHSNLWFEFESEVRP